MIINPKNTKLYEDLCAKTRNRVTLKGNTGPWLDEPDFKVWEYAGYSCQVVRNPMMLNWCGYVRVPLTHPLANKKGEELDTNMGLDVHGGITFNEEYQGGWWFGFDCAHWGDLIPVFDEDFLISYNGVYRTIEFAQRETEELARQLKALE